MIASFEDYTWPMKDATKRPFDNQKKTTTFLLSNKRAYVLNEMRTGKTLSVLWATDVLFHFERIKKVLIVCPLSIIKIVWAQSIFENFPHRRYAIAHGSRDFRSKAISSDVHYVIINHDGIKSVMASILAEKFDLIIIDELTAYKNAQSDRSECVRLITKDVPAVWGLTGNPTPNSPTEAFGQAKVVNPSNPYLPRFYSRFRDMVETQIAPYMWAPRPNAKDIVYQVLQPAIRFTRKECFDIPSMMYRDIELDMSPEQWKVYDAIRNELYYQYDKGEISIANAGVKFSKLLQVSSGAVRNDNGDVHYIDDKPKYDHILETFEEDGRKKLVVASAFVASVEHLVARLQKDKIKAAFIHGGVSPNQRFDIMRNFQDGDLQILVVQPQAVSHGTCFDASHITIWHSLVTSGEVYCQMNDRIISASQTEHQFIDHLICSKADAHAVKIASKKLDMSSSILELFANKDL